MIRLRDLFASLPPPPESDMPIPILSAVLIPGFESFRIARDAKNRALLLVQAPAKTGDSGIPPVNLEHLRIDYARPCRIRYPDGHLEPGTFTVFSCLSSDEVLREHFLLVIGLLVEVLGNAPSPAALGKAVGNMIELFRALQQPARKTIQGLWAEVFLISQARQPDIVLGAWHISPEGCYDFSMGPERIEVKSVSSPPRQHYFLLEQVRPPLGARVVIASLFVGRAGGGTSLEELLASLRTRPGLTPELLLRAQAVIASTLGDSLRMGLGERFDFELACDSLAFFASEQVPSVQGPPPSAVSQVRFRSDLTYVTPLRRLVEQGSEGPSLFAAATPRGGR